MGDHRADIKIDFTFHGKTYRQEWWINWFPDGEREGCDRRITEWFSKCAAEGYARYDAQVAEYFEREHANDIKKSELAELARLKAKYESA